MQSVSTENINHQAREWFVALQSGAVSHAQREAFTRWMETNEHAQAFREYEMVWASLGELAVSPEGQSLRASVAPRPWVPTWFMGWIQLGSFARASFVGGLALMAFVAVIFVFSAAPIPKVVEYKTAVAEQKNITLADGSELTLSAKTHVRAWQTSTERHVELVQGLAFFSVKKDAERPFFVQADGVNVRVVGTQFDVSNQGQVVRVSVLEGQVSVQEVAAMSAVQVPDGQQKERVFSLSPGQAVEKIGMKSLQTIHQQELQVAGAWRDGQLIYRNARLADIVADANRYFEGEIILASPQLQSERVTLALRIDQVAVFPELLAKTLPVVVHRESGSRVLILAAANDKD